MNGPSIPEPDATTDLTMADGAVIKIRRHGNPDGARLVLCHGNGFAIDAYFPFWSLLLSQYDLVLYDQRNHGHNPRHTAQNHRLDSFVTDMEQIFHDIQTQFGAKPATGVFHSISGVTAVRHALEYGKRWAALVLFDPAMVPGPGRPEHEVGLKFELMLVEWAKKRPDRAASPEEFARNFSNAKTLSRWVPGAYELMSRSILHPENGTDEWSLNCPGTFESQIYKDNSETHQTEHMGALPLPVKLICADPTQPDALAPSKVGRAVHKEFGLPYEAIPDTSHLLPIERPGECARAVVGFVEGA